MFYAFREDGVEYEEVHVDDKIFFKKVIDNNNIIDNIDHKLHKPSNASKTKCTIESNNDRDSSSILDTNMKNNTENKDTTKENSINLHECPKDILIEMTKTIDKEKIETKTNIEKRKQQHPIRKRYSDQFKNPTFLEKDKYRKLKMIEKFSLENKDLKFVTDKYKDCITQSIEILKNEYMIPVKDIFDAFELKKYGFNGEDFGWEDEEENSD